MALFVVRDLHVRVEDKLVLCGVSFELSPGQIYALMGPNGSGKSTLAFALAGHPDYRILKGEVYLDGQDILPLPPHERARTGLFLAFQYPPRVEGLKLRKFLRVPKAFSFGPFSPAPRGFS